MFIFFKSKIEGRIFLFLAVIVVLFSWSARGQEAAAPEIFFKEKIFTADEVMEGTPIEHTYTVYNRGNALLRILKVSPG